MKKSIFLIFILLSIFLLIIRFGSPYLISALGLEPRAGIRVESQPEASVSLNGKEVGKTPFENSNLKPREYLVQIKSDKGSWRGYVNLEGRTQAIVNRDLSLTAASSSGEVITLEKGSGTTLISTPDSAQVEIDGKNYGSTPLLVKDLPSGEHTFLISHNNFLKRIIRALVIKDYVLNINVDLAISEPDFTKITATPIEVSRQVKVGNTPTGFLRVRNDPSVAGAEIGRVSPGDILILIEEVPNWYKVRIEGGKEGYVSSNYIEKI